MSIESVRVFLEDYGLASSVREFATTTETVELAAAALGVAPALIAKTLALKVEGRGILLVTRGDARIDNRKFKQFFGVKARMIPPDEVAALSGHPVGGVCPFGLKEPLAIYIDESLRPFALVYPAAGSKNSCLEISPDELSRITRAHWVDVCRSGD